MYGCSLFPTTLLNVCKQINVTIPRTVQYDNYGVSKHTQCLYNT